MQDAARSHTAKLNFEILKDKKQLPLQLPHHWSLNTPDLNPVDFGIWGFLEQNIYRGRRITDLDCLKEAIVIKWNKFPQEIIDKCIDAVKPRLRRVIEAEVRHIEPY